MKHTPSRRRKANDNRELLARLRAGYPDARCALTHRSPFELLAATILSAQCTDVRVNQVTPALFARWPTPAAMAVADPAELEAAVRPTGFFRNKARALSGMAQALMRHHGGAVPEDMEALLALPGVARKTANVVRGVAFGLASGVVVDTHVARLAARLGLSAHGDPKKIETDLMAQFSPDTWISLSHMLILHGRQVCAARRPACARCTLADICPSAAHSAMGAAPTRPARTRPRPAPPT